jgi:hypothetical protein
MNSLLDKHEVINQQSQICNESVAASAAPTNSNNRSPKARRLALGLAKTAASQLDEFVRPGALAFLGKAV